MKTASLRLPTHSPAAYGPRAARALVSVSVAELAQATGYTPGYLRTLERDYLRVASGDKTAQLAPLYAAQKIARALGVDVEIFYRLDPNRPTAKKPTVSSEAAIVGMKNARPVKAKSLHHFPLARRVAATARRTNSAE